MSKEYTLYTEALFAEDEEEKIDDDEDEDDQDWYDLIEKERLICS